MITVVDFKEKNAIVEAKFEPETSIVQIEFAEDNEKVEFSSTGTRTDVDFGIPGPAGEAGKDGKDGLPGKDGAPGKDGEPGITPHIGANDNWFVGDTDTGICARGLPGKEGAQGEQGPRGEKGDPFTYSDFTEEQLASLKGPSGDKGEKGDKGDKGDKGEPFVYSDFTEEQLASLKGEQGQPGADGKDGKDGYTPIKGVDYTDGKDGYTPVKNVDYFDGRDGRDGVDGYTPIKGIDYFDGSPGTDGKDGEPGLPGSDGYSPVKGVDYWTETDKQEINDELSGKYLPLSGGTMTGNILANGPREIGSSKQHFKRGYIDSLYMANTNSNTTSEYCFGMYQWNDNMTFTSRNAADNKWLKDCWQISGETGATNFTVEPTVGGKSFLELVYPKNTLYWSAVSTNPATTFGFGTWERVTISNLTGYVWKRTA